VINICAYSEKISQIGKAVGLLSKKVRVVREGHVAHIEFYITTNNSEYENFCYTIKPLMDGEYLTITMLDATWVGTETIGEEIPILYNEDVSSSVTANRLSTTRYLWGRPFDGSGDVSGDMSNVGAINSFIKPTLGDSTVAYLHITNFYSTKYDGVHMYVANKDNSNTLRPLILQNGYGNVGIGISEPEHKLDVNGNVGVRGPMAVKGSIFMSLNTALYMSDGHAGIYLSDYGIHWHNSDNTYHSSIMTCDGSTTTIYKPLHIESSINLTGSDQINGYNSGIALNFNCGKYVNTTIWGGQSNPIMRVFGEGRQVAIGAHSIDTPRGTLNVDGDVVFENARFITTSGFTDGDHAYTHAIYGGYHGIDVCEFYENEFRFKVNGGSITSLKLTPDDAIFNGAIQTHSCQYAGIYNGKARFWLGRDGSTNTWLQGATDTTNGGGRLYMSGYGATMLSEFIVYASKSTYIGNILAHGDVTAYSDIRLKNRIESVNNVLDNIDTLDVFRYTWKDREDKSVHIGVSAQQVQAIYPEFVLTSDTEDGTDYLTVNYAALATCIAIQGIKELAKKGDERDKKIVSLETEIKNLKERIKTLEAWS
jgi:hypothetical protein